MYFMQELPTNKANFILKNTQDFNQTTHVVPQEHNVFTDNISFYFYAIISIKNLMKMSCNGTSQLFQHNCLSFEVEYALQNAKCMLFNMVFFYLDCTRVSKWQMVETYETCWTVEICKYFFYFEFCFRNHMQNYPTMSREHSGKKLQITTEDILYKSHFKFWISEPHGLTISKISYFQSWQACCGKEWGEW